MHVIATNADGIKFCHVLRSVIKNISHDAHGRSRGIDIGIAHHELFQNVVLNGSREFFLAHALLFGGHDVAGQHWQHGARWFWDTLVDADLANNTQGWQWTAGCGADASPYFRIFNPVSQAERFDPEGSYVRRWIPELSGVAAPLVHQPWKDAGLLRKTGYSAPIVALGESREAALAAYRVMRNS